MKKKFKLFCILFALYVYMNYIKFDWNIYTKAGKMYYYPAWFIRAFLTWLICPIFLLEYFFKQTSIYRHIQKLQKSPEFQADMAKSMNMFNF